MIIKDKVIKEGQFCNNDMELALLPHATKICVGAFKDCIHLKKVQYGLDVDEIVIEESAFEGCVNLLDIDFMTKATKFDISEDAFKNLNQPITFHLPIGKNEYLEGYAKRHHFKVQKHL